MRSSRSAPRGLVEYRMLILLSKSSGRAQDSDLCLSIGRGQTFRLAGPKACNWPSDGETRASFGEGGHDGVHGARRAPPRGAGDRGVSSSDALPGGEIVVYEAPDGEVRVDVRLERETVWLTQQQMAELFGRERSVITKHLRNVFREGELDPGATSAKFAQVRTEGGGGLARGRPLQPRRDHLGRLPRQVPARHPVPHLGHAHAARPPAARLHAERAPRCGSAGWARSSRRSDCWPGRSRRTRWSPTRAAPCSTWCSATRAPGACCSSTTRTGWRQHRRRAGAADRRARRCDDARAAAASLREDLARPRRGGRALRPGARRRPGGDSRRHRADLRRPAALPERAGARCAPALLRHQGPSVR